MEYCSVSPPYTIPRRENQSLERRQSKRIKHLGDISRLVESHPELWDGLPPELQTQIEQPA